MKQKLLVLFTLFLVVTLTKAQVFTIDGNNLEWGSVPILTEPGVSPYAKVHRTTDSVFYMFDVSGTTDTLTYTDDNSFNVYINADDDYNTGSVLWMYDASGVDYEIKNTMTYAEAGSFTWQWHPINRVVSNTVGEAAFNINSLLTIPSQPVSAQIALEDNFGFGINYLVDGSAVYNPAVNWDFEGRKLYTVKPRTAIAIESTSDLLSTNAFSHPYMKDDSISYHLNFQSGAYSAQNLLQWASWLVDLNVAQVYDIKLTRKATDGGYFAVSLYDLETNTLVKAFDTLSYSASTAEYTEETLGQLDMTDVPTGSYMLKVMNPTTWGSYLRVQKISLSEVLSAENDITSFVLTEQTAAATIDAVGHTVSIEVGPEADITALTPTIEVSELATVSPVSGIEQDFTNPVNYTTTAEDGSVQVWVVTVSRIEYSGNDIVSFELSEQTAAATIDAVGHTVSIEVRSEADITALIPTIGVSEMATISPESGVAQDFTTPLNYTVTAEDGSIQIWVVTVSRIEYSGNDIVSFDLSEQTGTALINASDTIVSIEVAFGTDVSSLTPTVVISEAATIDPLNGVAQDFTSPVDYTVTAEDGSVKVWTVTVTIAPEVSNRADILEFSLTEQTGSAVISATDTTVSIEVDFGTDVSSLTPTIVISEAATITPLSGVDRDFSLPVAYTVTAEDGSIKNWTVTVAVALRSAADILEFSLTEQTGSAEIDATDTTVSIEVAFGTNISSLTPTIVISEAATINPLGGVAQDFTNPVAYAVTAEDGSIKNWNVTVTIALNSAADILEFSLTEQTGSAIIDVSDTTVSIEVAFGTDVSSLTPTIVISEAATIAPLDGVAQDFTNPVTYTATAEDGTIKDWNVTVAIALNSAADILEFTLTEQTGSAVINSSDTTISIEVAYGTDVSLLSPTIVVSDAATIAPLDGVAQDFTNPVTYTVTAEDGSIKEWIVTVTVAIAKSNKAEILEFSLTEQTGDAIIDAVNSTVSIEVAIGTDVTSLSPTIVVSEAATINPLSGVDQDFTDPVTYTVTAEDGTEKEWTITVNEAQPSATIGVQATAPLVYPNPFVNKLHLSKLDNVENVVVYTVTGKIVEELEVQSSELELNTSEYAKGIYLVSIQFNNGESQVMKVVK